jgi:hypothetical protein
MLKHNLIKYINDNEISLGLASIKTEIRSVTNMGHGRFAIDTIAEDEIIYRAGGLWLTEEEKEVYKEDYFQLVEGKWHFQGGLKYHLNGCHNHSCNPNAYLQDNIIRALYPIAKDEQITIDYSTFIYHNYTIIKECCCNSTECRKTITGNDWKLYDLPLKYNYRVSGTILRKWLLSQKS